MKKAIVMAASFVIGTAAAGFVLASEDLAKKSGCMGCHDMATKKMGPSFKDIAAKNKGKADAEAKILAELKAGKKHPAVKAPEADQKAVVKWVLAQ